MYNIIIIYIIYTKATYYQNQNEGWMETSTCKNVP